MFNERLNTRQHVTDLFTNVLNTAWVRDQCSQRREDLRGFQFVADVNAGLEKMSLCGVQILGIEIIPEPGVVQLSSTITTETFETPPYKKTTHTPKTGLQPPNWADAEVDTDGGRPWPLLRVHLWAKALC